MNTSFWHRLTNCDKYELIDLRNIDVNSYLDMMCEDMMFLFSSKKPYDTTKLNDCSLLSYGLSDLSRLNPRSEKDKRYIQLQIQHTLEKYEPRLNNIIVLSAENDKEDSPLLMTFLIKANLAMRFSSQVVTFDSVIETSLGSMLIKPSKELIHE